MSDPRLTATNLACCLKAYAQKHDLSLRDLAPLIGISIATLSRVGRGHEMDLRTFRKILDWLLADAPALTP